MKDGETGIAMRFIKQYDIDPDQAVVRVDRYDPLAICPFCHAPAHLGNGLWRCDPCSRYWLATTKPEAGA